MTPKRLPEIDAIRGIAVMAMIVFHVFFILDAQGILANEMDQGWFAGLGTFVRISFIGLAGISLALSFQKGKKHLARRGLWILALGYLITLVTWIAIPEEFVRFGILHVIGLGIVVFTPLAGRKYIPLLIGLGILATTPWVTQTSIGSETLDYLWHIIGFADRRGIVAVDHFPIFPWFAVMGIGVGVGNWAYRGSARRWRIMDVLDKVKIPSVLTWMGRHSLVIYLVHVPVVWGVVLIFS